VEYLLGQVMKEAKGATDPNEARKKILILIKKKK
jgi:Asp-tRNA(Asn)/Glu-tRNA(Gln) amidotransferase B subunit